MNSPAELQDDLKSELTRRDYLGVQATSTAIGVGNPEQVGKLLLQAAHTEQWQSEANKMAINNGLKAYFAAAKAWNDMLEDGIYGLTAQYQVSEQDNFQPLAWQLKQLWQGSGFHHHSQAFQAAQTGPPRAFFEFLESLTKQYSNTAIPEATELVTTGYLQSRQQISNVLTATEKKLAAELSAAQALKGDRRIAAFHNVAYRFGDFRRFHDISDHYACNLHLTRDEIFKQASDTNFISMLKTQLTNLNFDDYRINLQTMLHMQLIDLLPQYQNNPVFLQALQLAGFSDDETYSAKIDFWSCNGEVSSLNNLHPLDGQTWLCYTDFLNNDSPLPWQMFLKLAEKKIARDITWSIKVGLIRGPKVVSAQQQLTTLKSYRRQFLNKSDLTTTPATESIQQTSAAKRRRMELLVSLGIEERD